MTSLADTERLRARWRRALQRHALDTVTRDDFALSSLAARLKAPTVQLLALPEDPEAEALLFDDTLWTWLETQKCMDVEDRTIRFGDRKCPTAHAAVLVNGHESQAWSNYLAVHRSGAIELGFGNRGGWEGPNRAGGPVRVFSLISIVTYTWAALKFGAAHFGRLPGIGPWQLTLAVRGTEGALLSNLGEGWPEPVDFEYQMGSGCVDQNLLWHLELQDWPDEEGQQRLAFAVGDRLEDAWGVSQRRYLAHRGERAGRLDLRRIAG